ITQRIVEEGHDIANHTYTHRDLSPTTRQIVLYQIRKTEKAIFKATGVKTNLFRPPRGIYSNTVRKLLLKEGYKIILWTVSTLDWRQVSAEKMLRRVKLYVRDGGIVLFHDSGALLRREGASRERTIDALPLIIDYLRNEQGFKIIPVSEMLYRLEKAESEVLLGRAK
ncbi:MAG: polysaccharide deacetylase family protein, partial [Candidatus Subteraquimicrobiales bacterium]|nr:polysaccharide deacetylase family protein [Candidatus Subteraquimicrobiales bacterium]